MRDCRKVLVAVKQLDPENRPLRGQVHVQLIADVNRLDLRGLLPQADIRDVASGISLSNIACHGLVIQAYRESRLVGRGTLSA